MIDAVTVAVVFCLAFVLNYLSGIAGVLLSEAAEYIARQYRRARRRRRNKKSKKRFRKHAMR